MEGDDDEFVRMAVTKKKKRRGEEEEEDLEDFQDDGEEAGRGVGWGRGEKSVANTQTKP